MRCIYILKYYMLAFKNFNRSASLPHISGGYSKGEARAVLMMHLITKKEETDLKATLKRYN